MDLIIPCLLDEAETLSGALANLNPLKSPRTSEANLATISIQDLSVSGRAIGTSQVEGDKIEIDSRTTENQGLPDTLDGLVHLLSQMEVSDSSSSERTSQGRHVNNWGTYYAKKFGISGKLEEINQAVACHSWAVRVTSSTDSDKPGMLDDLATSHATRFKHRGDLADIDKAIEFHSQAALLTPDGHSDKLATLNNLGISHMRRFERLGNLADIDRAIECQYKAVLLTPDGLVNKPGRLSNLGISHQKRFKRLGDIVDMDRAIEYQSQAVLLTPEGHADKHRALSNLGNSHGTRFGRLGDLADIDKAIECQTQAVLLIPDGHVDKLGGLSNLGISHRKRFERLGDLADIDRAIECQSQVVLLTADGHADKPSRLINLGNSHGTKFEQLGNLADIDRAIACHHQAVLLTPDGHAGKPGGLSNLGNSYQSRFKRLGDLADIDRAIEYQSQAVLITPGGHTDKPGRLSNLGISHHRRFRCLGCIADIEKAIEFHSQAVLLIPDGHADKPAILNSLGNSHTIRFEHLGYLVDIDRAIACLSQAVSLVSNDNAARPRWLNNLSCTHKNRFEKFGDFTDIQKAIEYQYAALRLSPDWDIERLEILGNLGELHLCQFERLGNDADIIKATECLRMAAQCPAGKSSTRFKASRKWAQLSVLYDPPSTLLAYQWTMSLVPKVVWIGATVNRRHEHTRSIRTIAVEAAAVAISKREYGLALEWLEAGRSIVWSQTLQLRTQFENLFTVDSEFAQSLQRVAFALEHAGSQPLEPPTPLHDAHTLEAAAQNHRRLAEDYENLLTRARQMTGFHDFMSPKRVTELMPAAQYGPVVVVNVHASRCDALIMRPHTDNIIHVPLSDVSDTQVENLQRQMQGFNSRGVAARRPYFPPEEPGEPLESILSVLWHEIVKPVLSALGFTEKRSTDQLPHITWCTTGALALLPIHAAGCYDETGDNIFAYAISSYAPNISALLPSSCSLELGAILAVSQEATLPATKEELAHIKRHAGMLPYLQLEGNEATTDAVLDAMDQHNSVHLACHASQNLSQPLKSCFYLHDRGLSLADITKRSLRNKSLAFLSACQTATGDDQSPDEAIHLAAGMLVAGYPTVIATMWSIMDSDAPLVADLVYGELTKDGKLDDGKVARALHVAVGALRDRVGEKEFLRWAPFIHMGI